MTSVSPAGGTSGDVILIVEGRSLARTVLVGGLVLEIGFVILDYHVNYARLIDIGAIRRLANIAREDGLASWFGSAQTLLVGLTAWAFWLGVRARNAARLQQAGWLLVAALFTYMAVDDGVQLHERIGTASEAIRVRGASLFPSFAWQPLFVPAYGLLGAGAAAFLWREARARSARALVLLAFGLLATAVGLDFLEGLDPLHPWNPYTALVTRYDITAFTQARFRQLPYDTLVHFSRSAEEFFEMVANTCIWAAMLGHAGQVMPKVQIRNHTGEAGRS